MHSNHEVVCSADASVKQKGNQILLNVLETETDKIIVTFDPLAFFFCVGLLRNQNETWDFVSVSIYLILAAWKKIIREILPLDVSENRGTPKSSI